MGGRAPCARRLVLPLRARMLPQAADAQTDIVIPPGSPKNLEDIRLHLALLRGTKKTK